MHQEGVAETGYLFLTLISSWEKFGHLSQPPLHRRGRAVAFQPKKVGAGVALAAPGTNPQNPAICDIPRTPCES